MKKIWHENHDNVNDMTKNENDINGKWDIFVIYDEWKKWMKWNKNEQIIKKSY